MLAVLPNFLQIAECPRRTSQGYGTRLDFVSELYVLNNGEGQLPVLQVMLSEDFTKTALLHLRPPEF